MEPIMNHNIIGVQVAFLTDFCQYPNSYLVSFQLPLAICVLHRKCYICQRLINKQWLINNYSMLVVINKLLTFYNELFIKTYVHLLLTF